MFNIFRSNNKAKNVKGASRRSMINELKAFWGNSLGIIKTKMWGIYALIISAGIAMIIFLKKSTGSLGKSKQTSTLTPINCPKKPSKR